MEEAKCWKAGRHPKIEISLSHALVSVEQFGSRNLRVSFDRCTLFTLDAESKQRAVAQGSLPERCNPFRSGERTDRTESQSTLESSFCNTSNLPSATAYTSTPPPFHSLYTFHRYSIGLSSSPSAKQSHSLSGEQLSTPSFQLVVSSGGRSHSYYFFSQVEHSTANL